MHPSRVSWTSYKKWALVLVGLLGLAGLFGLGSHQLAVTRAQARALVDSGAVALKQGQRARATLDFERAALLAPRADFVRAKHEVRQARPTESWLVSQLSWVSPREWSWLLVGFGWATGLGLALAIAHRSKPSRARKLTWGGAALLFAVTAGAALETSMNARNLAVVGRATGALIAPYAGSGATADLSEGMVVSVGERYGNFVKIRGPGGTQGWADRTALEPVVGS
jgi:hypothetical protein